MKPHRYSPNIIKQMGSSFFYPMLFMAKEKREAMFALYAFCREVDDIVDNQHPTIDPRISLASWRQEIDNIFSGKPSNPIGHSINVGRQRFALQKEPFMAIIDGMEMDLDLQRYPDLATLETYCQRVAVAVGLAANNIFGAHGKVADRFAHHLGIAFQLTNILRDVVEDAKMDRIYLPLDILEAARASPADILAGQWSPNLATAISNISSIAEEHYRQATALVTPSLHPNLRPALIMSHIYHTYLEQIQRADFNIFATPISLSPSGKISAAIRAFYREYRPPFFK